MSFFSTGLLLNDIEDAAKLCGRDNIWIQSVYIFIRVENCNSFTEKEKEYDQFVQKMLMSGKSGLEICSLAYNNAALSFERDYILKLVSEEVFHKSNLVLQASSKLRRIITLTDEDNGQTILKVLIRVLNYYRNLMQAMICKLKSDLIFKENIIESSSFSSNYFWCDKDPCKDHFKSYVDHLSHQDIEEVMKFHEANIKVLLTGTDAFSVFGGLEYINKYPENRQKFLEQFEDFVLKTLSLYTSPINGEISVEMMTHVRQIIEDSTEIGIPLVRLDIKVELNWLSNTIQRNKKSWKPMTKAQTDQLEQQVRLIQDLIESYEEHDALAFRIEFIHLQYSLIKTKKIKTGSNKYEFIVESLRSCILEIPPEESEEYCILKAKSQLILAEISNLNNEASSIERTLSLQHALSTFEKKKLYMMVVKTSEMLIKQNSCCLSRNQKADAANLAQKSAELMNNTEMDKFFKKVLSESVVSDGNKFVFINSYIIDKNKYAGPQVLMRFGKELRSILIDTLNHSGKSIMCDFTDYTTGALKQYLDKNKNCRLCVVDVPITNNDNLDKNTCRIRSPVFSESIRSSFHDASISSRTVDRNPMDVLLILGDLLDSECLEIIENSEIPFVITLNFTKMVESKFDLFNMWLVTQFKYIYVQKFVKFVVDGIPISSCIELAKQQALDEIQQNLRTYHILDRGPDSQMTPDCEEQMSESMQIDLIAYFGTVLIVNVNTQKKKLNIELKNGFIEETDSPFSRNKLLPIHKDREPIQRDKMIQKTNSATTKSNIVNLYGKSGIGKTSFIRTFINQTIVSGEYTNGVYFFELEQYARDNPHGNIKDLMKQQLGESYMKNASDFFMNKKMMIIFDDFHVISEEHRLIFPIHLIQLLIKNQIKVILMSHKRITVDIEEYTTAIKYIKMAKLSAEESLMLFLYSQLKIFIKYDRKFFHHMMYSRLINMSKGYPDRIYHHSGDFLKDVIKFRSSREFCGNPENLAEDTAYTECHSKDSFLLFDADKRTQSEFISRHYDTTTRSNDRNLNDLRHFHKVQSERRPRKRRQYKSRSNMQYLDTRSEMN